MKYWDTADSGECPHCIAWKCEADRAALLLELLAEDHFPDQAAFDEWMDRQMSIALREPTP